VAAATNYFRRAWQVEQGPPQNKVTAVVQTHDGYLWVGTYYGLARFDGVHFTVFDVNNTPELHSSCITSVFEAAGRTLWIGMEGGDDVWLMNGAGELARAGWQSVVAAFGPGDQCRLPDAQEGQHGLGRTGGTGFAAQARPVAAR
jgi:hypothetical protein